MESIINFLQNTCGLSRDYSFLSVGILIGFILVAFSKPKSKNESLDRARSGAISSISHTKGLGRPDSSNINIDNLVTATKISNNIISMDGKNLNIDDQSISQIQEFLKKGDKIQAIKLLREKTGLGLAEAKSLIETLETIVLIKR